MARTAYSRLYNLLRDVVNVKSENMVDPLQFAAIAGCKTKPVEEWSVILA